MGEESKLNNSGGYERERSNVRVSTARIKVNRKSHTETITPFAQERSYSNVKEMMNREASGLQTNLKEERSKSNLSASMVRRERSFDRERSSVGDKRTRIKRVHRTRRAIVVSHPNTGEKIPLDQAVKEGLITPEQAAKLKEQVKGSYSRESSRVSEASDKSK